MAFLLSGMILFTRNDKRAEDECGDVLLDHTTVFSVSSRETTWRPSSQVALHVFPMYDLDGWMFSSNVAPSDRTHMGTVGFESNAWFDDYGEFGTVLDQCSTVGFLRVEANAEDAKPYTWMIQNVDSNGVATHTSQVRDRASLLHFAETSDAEDEGTVGVYAAGPLEQFGNFSWHLRDRGGGSLLLGHVPIITEDGGVGSASISLPVMHTVSHELRDYFGITLPGAGSALYTSDGKVLGVSTATHEDHAHGDEHADEHGYAEHADEHGYEEHGYADHADEHDNEEHALEHGYEEHAHAHGYEEHEHSYLDEHGDEENDHTGENYSDHEAHVDDEFDYELVDEEHADEHGFEEHADEHGYEEHAVEHDDHDEHGASDGLTDIPDETGDIGKAVRLVTQRCVSLCPERDCLFTEDDVVITVTQIVLTEFGVPSSSERWCLLISVPSTSVHSAYEVHQFTNKVSSFLLTGAVTVSCVLLGFSVCGSLQAQAADWHDKQKDEVRQGVEAEGAVQTLSYPMTFVDAHDVLNMSAWECHEEWRDRGKLTLLDTLEEVHKFKELPASRDRVQMRVMQGALSSVCKNSEKRVYVWVDYLCVAQRYPECQTIAVAALPVYVSVTNLFIICAPDGVHQDTGLTCGLATYSQRGWCRAEMLSKAAGSGLSHILFCHGHNQVQELRDLKEQCHSFRVFEGSFTHDADKETLVQPSLGLFSLMLRQANKKALQRVLDEINSDPPGFFPPDYELHVEGSPSLSSLVFPRGAPSVAVFFFPPLFPFASGVAPPSFSVPLPVLPSLLVVVVCVCVLSCFLVFLFVVVVFRFVFGSGWGFGCFPLFWRLLLPWLMHFLFMSCPRTLSTCASFSTGFYRSQFVLRCCDFLGFQLCIYVAGPRALEFILVASGDGGTTAPGYSLLSPSTSPLTVLSTFS